VFARTGARARGGLVHAALALLFLSGCRELQARRHAREGNRLYSEGNYAGAVDQYRVAQALAPELPVITLNEGLACRQLIVPRAKSAENQKAVQCALDAFDRLKRLAPHDARAKQLYLQTLFDADEYERLVAVYTERLQSNPSDLEAVNGLVEVYSRSDRWDDALHWMTRRAEISKNDADAQYAVGVFIWRRLFDRGGSGDRATYDPRADAGLRPVFGQDEIAGGERLRLADQGISYLQRALAIRPNYREAMTYLGLLYRQRSYAFFDRPEDWLASVEAATSWQKKSMEVAAPPAALPADTAHHDGDR